MASTTFKNVFRQEELDRIFPPERTDRFFEALYGDAAEGAYDISLAYAGESADRIRFAFHLKRRTGKCLACNLTYGLPEVFRRHPVIDMDNLVRRLCDRLGGAATCRDWSLAPTQEVSQDLHRVVLSIRLTAS